MPHHGHLFRETFRHPEDVAGLIASCLPPEVAQAFAWSTLRREEGSFIDAHLAEHHADLLFSVLVGGRPVLLYLLCEHKSRQDPDTSFQLLRYMVRIWERWRQEHPTGLLPAILPFVLHHGARPWVGAPRFHQRLALADLPEAVAAFLRGMLPDVSFVLDDLAAQTEDELDRRSMSAIARISVLLLQHVHRLPATEVEATIARWQHVVAAALRQRGQQGLLVLWSYLFATTEAEPERVLALLPQPLRRRLEKTLMSTAERLRNEGHAQGHIEGRTEGHLEGRAEGRAELLLRLLERRFGPLPPAIRKRVHAAEGAQFDRWADAFVDARTLADVFAA